MANKLLTIFTIAVIFATISMATAQNGYYNENHNNYYAEKPGSCAPALPVSICIQTCFADRQCRGPGKCCPTACGGTVCASPVTMRKPNPVVKAGYCPTVPTGRWVCTATCSTDGDCPNVRKCCKNRCGAMACQKPQSELVAPDNSDAYVAPLSNPFVVFAN